MDKTRSPLRVKHLIYLIIFSITLVFRLYAAEKLNITQSEADILLNLTRTSEATSGSSGSLLYQLLTLPLMAIFGSGNLVVRF